MKKFKPEIFFLFFLIFLALFLRFWNFDDWLVFTSDQARDAYYAKEAYDGGPGQLRLLGPKIDMAYIEGDENKRGDTLHLGPFYYYLQYFFVLLFGSVQPWVVALPDLLMFILSIPLFYYLSGYFFSKKISLLTTALFSFSFFNFLYSRFSWNPNQLFFWEILLILSLLKISLPLEEKKGRWLVITVLSLLIISQVHFIAFIGFGLFSFVFLLFYRPIKIRLKYWAISFLLVLIFFTPIIISDVKNKGDNCLRFWAAVNKQEDPELFSKKLSKTYDRFGEFFSFSLTSFHEREIEFIEGAGGIFFISSLIFVIIIFVLNSSVLGSFTKKSKFIITKNQDKLIFIMLLWVACFFIVFLKIYEKLGNERYFIMLSPLIFFIIGFWLSLFEKFRRKSVGNGIIFFISAVFLFFNLQAIFSFYDTLNEGKNTFRFGRNLKLCGYEDLITFGQMREAFIYMAKDALSKNRMLCLQNADYQYNSGFEYISELYYNKIIFKRFNNLKIYSDCVYFVTGKTLRGERDIDEDLLTKFEIMSQEKFGALSVWKLGLKDEVAKLDTKIIEEKERSSSKRKRAEKWEELFQEPPYNF